MVKKGENKDEDNNKEEPNIDLKGNSVTMINNENDKKDNENQEIQEITISSDNKPENENPEIQANILN